MKKLILSLVAIATISLSSFGQAPEGFKYQAVVRDAGNLILNNQAVGMRLTVQQGSIGGTAVYTETFSPTSNAYGLVNIEIGSGNTTDDFSTIDWSAGPYFIETAMDATGGTAYVVMGTSQLMSVPYALYAKTAENVLDSTGIANMGFVASSGTCGLSIGDWHAGGIIFYLDGTGCSGLVAAPTDLSTAAEWGCFGALIAGADGTAIGTGYQNTIDIEAGCVTAGTAADICANYTDWFLPSKDELNLMYENIGQGNVLGLGNVGGFANYFYWSSTEGGFNYAWAQSFYVGNQNIYVKGSNYYVRSVRSF